MSENGKKIYVYDSFSEEIPALMGILFVENIKGNETFSFEYDEKWLRMNGNCYSLDPELYPFRGRQFSEKAEGFGMFSDASPDRWGRILMKKREKLLAAKEGRKPNKLNGSDYLLGVYDATRMGGLRFKLDPEGEFVSEDKEEAVPPWTTLRTLEEAARRFQEDEATMNDLWLNQLIRPGSSLGGARPKATVIDPDGQLWIAKFPSKNDENNTGVWEKIASDLGKMCGLNTPESKLETFSQYGGTFLVKRFDRNGNKRVHFASAMTLLGKTDGSNATDGSSYLEIAEFIKANGAQPQRDLRELWKRIVFNMAISNTDDHLRNHAFLAEKKGWVLSPVYDVNPVPYGNELSLNVSETDNRISILTAIQESEKYGIVSSEAIKIATEMTRIIRENWEKSAIRYGLTRGQIEDMRPAFTACYEEIQ